MSKKKWQFIKGLVLAALFSIGLFWLVFSPKATAQEDDSQPVTIGGSLIVISSSDASSAPTIVLRAYGIDGKGNPIDLSSSTISLTHDGVEVGNAMTVGEYKAGTLTIFLVDAPPGVDAQMNSLQQAIEQFASPPEMEESVDYVSIYQAGATEANQLLAPTNFYNSIRNFFATPLEVQSGPTALADSLGALLDEIETLKPKDDLFVSIVVITDGTDVVSTKYQPDQIGEKAAALGVPIHTIWLENEELQAFSHQGGQEYLAQLAADSRGLASNLDQTDQLQAIWDRIGAFRNQQVIQYQPDPLTGGTYDVILSLLNDPEIQASTSVVISTAAPSINLDLPPDSRQLTLKNLEEPISLTFAPTVSWLDGVERELTTATLIVNGVPVQEIDVNDINQFTAEISNFNYGLNSIQISITDNQGLEASSPEILMTVLEGETQVPEAIEAESLLGSQMMNLVVGCLLVLVLLAILVLLIVAIRRRRSSQMPEPRERQPMAVSTIREATRLPVEPSGAAETDRSYLEIIHSVTRMPSTVIPLSAVEHRIGRNPTQADIAFENDITVSRLHASIILEGNDYRIYDEGSTSGTWLNGQPIPQYGSQLIDGDELQLGDVLVIYRRG
jgi:hypothetical protein